MIFVTVGTNEAPFERLLRAIDDLAVDEELVVQTGPAVTRPKGAQCVAFLPFIELVSLVRSARTVIMHAGVGSVMVALGEGVRPVVMPRLRRHGEAVDDHQVVFGRRMADIGLVTFAEDAQSLARAIEPASRLESAPQGASLARDLRTYIDHVVHGAGSQR